MRSRVAVLAAGLVLAGCGGGDEELSIPAPSGEEDGKPAVAVADEAEASRLCKAAQESWPESFAETGADAVTFDVPSEGGEDADLICARP